MLREIISIAWADVGDRRKMGPLWAHFLIEMRHENFFLSIVSTLLIIGAPSFARKAAYSWRKPENSYSNFVKDSVDCGIYGYNRDVSKDEPAKAFVRGWRTADDYLNRAGANADAGADDWSAIQRRH